MWLKINLVKSKLIPIGRVENMEDMALNIGYKVGNPSSTYLGLPLVPSVNQWQLGMGGRVIS